MSDNRKPSSLFLLPPQPSFCQECAVKHGPHEPHNQQSLFYHVKFNMEFGREPTWTDAMAHCSEEMKKAWIYELNKHGINI